MKIHSEFSAQGTKKGSQARKGEGTMDKPNNKKAVMAKFSVLKGIRPQVAPMRMVTMKCAGQCTCRCS
jgi:ribosomal protein S25